MITARWPRPLHLPVLNMSLLSPSSLSLERVTELDVLLTSPRLPPDLRRSLPLSSGAVAD